MKLIILRGPSCSGKSTYAKHFDDNFPNCVLNADALREILTGDMGNQQFNKEIFDILKNMLIIRLKAGCEVTVWDNTTLRLRDIRYLIELALLSVESVNDLEIEILNFQASDLQQLLTRNEQRAARGGLMVPPHAITRMYETAKANQKQLEDFVNFKNNVTLRNIQL